jgi:hypothetical protein
MNVIRILLLIGAVWLAWRLFKQLTRPQIPPPQAPPSPPGYEPMARCSECGVHAPEATLSPSGRCGRCSG